MRNIKELKNIKGRRVILRVDFNVPIKEGKVIDDFRIRASLPTVNFLLKKGAKITIVTHLGKGGESLDPVKKSFFKLLKIKNSGIEFLENIRNSPLEEKNDTNFARRLAGMGDIYVNDAFSVSHRSHASIVGIPKYLPHYAGLQLESEVKHLSLVTKDTKHPFLFILGGAKFSTKMPLIKKYLKKADYVFVAGALFNDILKDQGFEVGKSLVDDSVSLPPSITKNKKILLPIDVLVKSSGKIVNKNLDEISKSDTIIDAGNGTIKLLENIVNKSKLILWNGPLGKYEDGGDKATKSILKSIAKSKAISIIGGGDTAEVVNELKIADKFTFVSTGGGATLEFLSAGTLPGIKALK